MRSRAAAAVLLGAGFGEVHSMEGGIDAWEGLVADASPDAGITYFLNAGSPEAMLALAWSMEEGARRFYAAVADGATNDRFGRIFSGLVQAEAHHKQSLEEIQERLFPEAPKPESVLGASGLLGNMAESGRPVEELIEAVQGRGEEEVLSFSMALETNSLDLYLKMVEAAPDPKAKEVFASLAAEERAHLSSLGAVLDEYQHPDG